MGVKLRRYGIYCAALLPVLVRLLVNFGGRAVRFDKDINKVTVFEKCWE